MEAGARPLRGERCKRGRCPAVHSRVRFRCGEDLSKGEKGHEMDDRGREGRTRCQVKLVRTTQMYISCSNLNT